MCKSICGADCSSCGYGKENNCKGCAKSNGCPFGEQCFVASYINMNGIDSFNGFKNQLISEFNELKIEGMPKITELYPMNGEYVNVEYPLPNGKTAKFLNDKSVYLTNQVECEFNDGEYNRCFGIVAGMDFLLVAEYGENCSNLELVMYKKR